MVSEEKLKIVEKVAPLAGPEGIAVAAGAAALAAKQKRKEEEKRKEKTAESSPFMFFFIAIAIYLVDFLLKFNGLDLDAYQITNIHFLRGIILNGFVIISLISYYFFAQIHLREKESQIKFFSYAGLILTLSLIFSLGGINAGILHLLLVFFLYYLYYKEAPDKSSVNFTFAVLLWIDFFGYIFIPKILGSYFPSVTEDILSKIANRLIFPIWLIYVLGTKRKQNKILAWITAGLIIMLLFYFASGLIFMNSVEKKTITPEQIEEAKGFFAASFANMARFWYEMLIDPVRCAGLIGKSPEEYDKCLLIKKIRRACPEEVGETEEECVKRKLEAQKTTGAVDRTITDYVDVTLEPSTTKKDFAEQEDIEIIYKLTVKSPKVPVIISNIKCEFINQETKEKRVGYTRTTLPLNKETKITAGGVFITCILLPEDRKPGKYENIVTVEIQDVDTYATLALYFMGNKELLYSQIGYGTYQEQFANERKIWPNEVNAVLIEGKVQSRAYPGLIWPKIGEPLDNNKITTLPIKGLQEGESIQLVMSLINKATGKITRIRDLVLELPEHTAVTPQGACSKFQSVGANIFSIAQTEEGKNWLNNKVLRLAKQEKESEEDFLSCNIQITNYPRFIDNPNMPSGPKYFTVKIKDYNYEIQEKHKFTISKPLTAEEVLGR